MTEEEKPVNITPHVAETKVESIKEDENLTTKILISLDAYQDINCIITNCGDNEIGWLGTVKVIDGNQFLIEKIFIPYQDTSYGHCEFSKELLGKFYTDMLKKDKENRTLLNSIMFWGHLHPGNDVDPSGQDDDQMEIFSNNKFFIRGIFGREGMAKFDIFNYSTGVKIIDVPWQLYIPEDPKRKEFILKEIKTKVKEEKFTYVRAYPGYKGGLIE